jgi:hypothetical protein
VGALIFLGAVAILVALHPAHREFFKLGHSLSAPLAAVSLLAAVPAGGDVVVLEGRAEVLTAHAGELPLSDYFTKYGTWIQRLAQMPEGVVQSYSQPIRITPTRCIGWKA